MRISDWSSDVCSSDLDVRVRSFIGVEPDRAGHRLAARRAVTGEPAQVITQQVQHAAGRRTHASASNNRNATARRCASRPSALASITAHGPIAARPSDAADCTLIAIWKLATVSPRSEEHTSELQAIMRISYDVFCL